MFTFLKETLASENVKQTVLIFGVRDWSQLWVIFQNIFLPALTAHGHEIVRHYNTKTSNFAAPAAQKHICPGATAPKREFSPMPTAANISNFPTALEPKHHISYSETCGAKTGLFQAPMATTFFFGACGARITSGDI